MISAKDKEQIKKLITEAERKSHSELFGRSLITDAELAAQVRAHTLDRLKPSV